MAVIFSTIPTSLRCSSVGPNQSANICSRRFCRIGGSVLSFLLTSLLEPLPVNLWPYTKKLWPFWVKITAMLSSCCWQRWSLVCGCSLPKDHVLKLKRKEVQIWYFKIALTGSVELCWSYWMVSVTFKLKKLKRGWSQKQIAQEAFSSPDSITYVLPKVYCWN